MERKGRTKLARRLTTSPHQTVQKTPDRPPILEPSQLRSVAGFGLTAGITSRRDARVVPPALRRAERTFPARGRVRALPRSRCRTRTRAGVAGLPSLPARPGRNCAGDRAGAARSPPKIDRG